MADFSKQWCELNDPEMPHDFDIDSVASTIDPLWYKSYICEGFGFTAIGKDADNRITLYFPSEDNESGEWKDYLDYLSKQTEKINDSI
jgi:hypothetical protein